MNKLDTRRFKKVLKMYDLLESRGMVLELMKKHHSDNEQFKKLQEQLLIIDKCLQGMNHRL